MSWKRTKRMDVFVCLFVCFFFFGLMKKTGSELSSVEDLYGFVDVLSLEDE